MPASNARIGYGTTFAIGTSGNSPTFTPVAEVKSLKGLKYKKDQVEVTHLSSPSGFKEFVDGMKDFDAVSGTYNYVPGGTAETALLAAYSSATLLPYQITFPNGATWTFPGVMTECAPGDLDVDKVMEGSFTIKPASAATIASGAPATAYSLTGPSSGTTGSPSSNFTVAANGTLSSNVIVTPSDGGAGGTFTPATVTLTPNSLSATFTYTAASNGAKTLSTSDSGSLIDPPALTYTASAVVTLSALTLSTAAFSTGAATGTVLTTISGKTAGSAVSIASSDTSGRFTVNGAGTQLLAGPNYAGTAAGSYNVVLTETLAGATNTPRTTTVAATLTASVTLAPLALSTASFPVGVVAGTVLATISGQTAGSAIAIAASDTSGRFSVNGAGTQLLAGLNYPTTSTGAYNVVLTETLAGATNTPRTTTIGSVVAAASTAYTALAVKNIWAVPGTNVIQVLFDKLLNTTAPAAAAFAVTNSGGAQTVSSVAVNGAQVLLTMSRNTANGETVSVTHTPANGPVLSVDGVAATAFTNQAVYVNASPAKLTRNSRIVQPGDSITQYGANGGSNQPLGFAFQGDLPALHAITGQYNIDVFPSFADTNPGWQGSNQGVAGDTYPAIIQRAVDSIGYVPDAMVIAGGTNDGPTSAAATQYCNAAQSAHDGGVRWVIMRAVPPTRGAQWNTSKRDGQISFNTTVKAFCDANPTWCIWYDVWTPNVDGTFAANVGYLNPDDLHPSTYGCYLNAAILKPLLDAITVDTTNSLTTDFVANNVLSNSTFTGTTGTLSGTGLTGSAPTGWTISGFSSTTTGVASLSANATTGGQSLSIVCTPGAGTSYQSISIAPSSAPALTPGTWYQMWAEVESNCGSMIGYDYPACSISGTAQPGGRTSNSVGSPGNLDTTYSSLQTKRFIKTPPYLAGSGDTAKIGFRVFQTGNAGATSTPYTVKIHRVFLVPVQDPFITWNTGGPPINTTAPTVTGTLGVGNALTLNPGVYANLLSNAGSQGTRYSADLYRDGVYVSTVSWSSGNGSYTQVAADYEAALSFKFSAANHAISRSPLVQIAAGTVPAPTWKSAYDFVADTGLTNGSAVANSTVSLTVGRTTTGYDDLLTTSFATNVARRTNVGGLLVEAGRDYLLWPSLPNTANWVYASGCSANVGGGGAFGLVTNATRITFTADTGVAYRQGTGQGGYRTMTAWVKCQASDIGKQIGLSISSGTPANNNAVFTVLDGTWQKVQRKNYYADNGNMNFGFVMPVGQSSMVLDVAWVGDTTEYGAAPCPLITTTANINAAAEAVTVTVPTGATKAVWQTMDNVKGSSTVTAGATYTFPYSLTSNAYKSLKFI